MTARAISKGHLALVDDRTDVEREIAAILAQACADAGVAVPELRALLAQAEAERDTLRAELRELRSRIGQSGCGVTTDGGEW